ncbi:hypothetical protein KOR42_22910 [Thalassoglobus neptunius]|uniref:Uncharacterized protein n=1 Tax=Thalassoglobus neptunius TaxID=1938619 RepID=A0A5C5X7L5_9PLAN|nr:hypothetical protein [Thalassoglobus neptunius]TWT58904.1 hypothetical protein KOR42_22910 [Thalassoglobus neptunius]
MEFEGVSVSPELWKLIQSGGLIAVAVAILWPRIGQALEFVKSRASGLMESRKTPDSWARSDVDVLSEVSRIIQIRVEDEDGRVHTIRMKDAKALDLYHQLESNYSGHVLEDDE